MRREDKIMLFTFIIVCSLITLGVVAIRQSVVEPVTQEQKQEETIEVAEETVKPSVADVEVKPTTEDVKVEDKQEVVKPKEVTKPKKEEKKVEVVKEVEQVEVSEVTKLEKAQEVASNTMVQYEGSYSVAIEDIGIMVLLNVEEFTEAEQFNALDVDQAIRKALRVNECEVPSAIVVVDINTNEVYFTVANGQIL